MRKFFKNRKVLTAISVCLTLLIISFLIFFLYKNKEDLTLILNLDLQTYLILLALTIIPLFNDGQILNLFTKPFNVILKERFLIIVTVNFLNAITPIKGGTGLRAIYMKKNITWTTQNFSNR